MAEGYLHKLRRKRGSYSSTNGKRCLRGQSIAECRWFGGLGWGHKGKKILHSTTAKVSVVNSGHRSQGKGGRPRLLPRHRKKRSRVKMGDSRCANCQRIGTKLVVEERSTKGRSEGENKSAKRTKTVKQGALKNRRLVVRDLIQERLPRSRTN